MGITVLAIVVLALMNMALLSLGLQNRMIAAKDTAEIIARSAADSGLTKALFEMNEKISLGPWDGSTLPQATDFALTNSDSTFDFTITGTSPSDGYNIEVTGKVGRIQRKVYSGFKLKSLFDGPILVMETIVLGNNVLIDGYNSSDPTDTDVDIDIGTLADESEGGSITIGLGSVVDGDVFVGTDGNTDAVIDNEGTINGVETPLYFDVELPTITPPSLTDMGTNIDATLDLTIGPAQTGQYTGIYVGSGSTLTIDGGDVVLYITGDIVLDVGAVITLKSGSTLTIYLDGNFDADSSDGFINETGVPSSFKLFGTGTTPVAQEYILKNGGEMFGVVYAPNANVIFKNNGDITGSIIAKNFEMKNNGTFLYDEALRDVDVGEVGTTFVTNMWRE